MSRAEKPHGEPRVGEPQAKAAGLGGIVAGLRYAWGKPGVARGSRALLRINQVDGFDCPGCAWPEPDDRSRAEFCENGAKAVAEETTRHHVDPQFFATHPISELAAWDDHRLGRSGRVTHPMVRRPGSDHYEAISWDDALALLARGLRELDSPDEALFYTSGRTSNEAAFLYQLLARAYGTNNLPDCSNMCHESSGVALAGTIGIGKGSVTLEDIHRAELIVVVGQNPGTNHPRMLTALEKAKRGGARIIAVNPLPEAGLLNFKNPQTLRGLAGGGTQLTDQFLRIRGGGDQALFAAIGSLLREWKAEDRAFIDEHTSGYAAYAETPLDWKAVETTTGLTREEITEAARAFADSGATIVCWAMGLTQHRDAVATIREIVNVQLLRGMIGKPGAGLCPVRGHSNVQGDRTMGITEIPPPWTDALEREFGIQVPREPGFHTVDAIRAMRDGRARIFVGLGGNFAAAGPDTAVVEKALRGCDLTVHISTTLNRSHVVCGRTALILPTLGRTEHDHQTAGPQSVTVEDSMSRVHASRGRLAPASPFLLSEVAILCRLGRELLGDTIPWKSFMDDYRAVRERIARVVPGFDDYERRVRGSGFTLPHPPRDARRFDTPDGKARFTANELSTIEVPEGRLLLQSLRSHDQYNTTIYGLDDRYRGVKNGRRVVFAHADDLTALGVADGSHVDLVSEWQDGSTRRVRDFRVVAYPIARGCAATYFPEANPLVPLDATATGSHTPTSKAIVVRLEPAQ
ncbi:FdhF/YdeP family oxidoreductase [Stackebrandtia nassauensis]|uniref:Oxidoreductase alpha (Molybdopterin) subunit n=1 Tax=Stackebrandtia nassauensis (strain DSM 44728 / CIP 108903 / NRRL B-16338 / NBRC 102104 / LLR-40K-21) TaxID=446470 RepID=D3Q009_STANL|nr:FdhF/YdeP family oxidoreductase [Stackebrandtia nassauensis]ADD45538.1 oxidoreductase alpha (molybdopterin) subunit [Stackebrandtia nassauensis DSM 44728]